MSGRAVREEGQAKPHGRQGDSDLHPRFDGGRRRGTLRQETHLATKLRRHRCVQYWRLETPPLRDDEPGSPLSLLGRPIRSRRPFFRWVGVGVPGIHGSSDFGDECSLAVQSGFVCRRGRGCGSLAQRYRSQDGFPVLRPRL
jgi:hypothetical protein